MVTAASEEPLTWQERVRTFERKFDYSGSEDWNKTERLKARIAEFRCDPTTRGLSMELFEEVVEWKLRKQRPRTETRREPLTPELVQALTDCAFSVDHPDWDVLASVQIGVIRSLPGVGIGLASAVLALTFPESYGVIDFRVWKIAFGSEKRAFTIPHYVNYLDELRTFALEAGWPVQKADFMIWSYCDTV